MSILDAPWLRHARCRDADPAAFFPTVEETVEPALRICAGCPVRDDCARAALDRAETIGVWGGLTPNDRREIRAGRMTLLDAWERNDRRANAPPPEPIDSTEPVEPVDDETLVDAMQTAAGIPLDDLRDKRQARQVTDRLRAAIEVGDRLGASSTRIGRIVGRDHTTVLHHLGRTKRFTPADTERYASAIPHDERDTQ